MIDFLAPFFQSIKYKNLKLEVMEVNKIPKWARVDWKVYKEILFHILQNAIKFNVDYGSINILLSFHGAETDDDDILIHEEPLVAIEQLNSLAEIKASCQSSNTHQHLTSKDTVSPIAKKQGYLLTQVVDTGIGIKP